MPVKNTKVATGTARLQGDGSRGGREEVEEDEDGGRGERETVFERDGQLKDA